MINLKFSYPIFVFKKGDKNLYASDKKDKLEVYSKEGGKFYKELKVIDSNGYVYIMSSSSIKGKASIWDSIKHLQPMYEMDLVFEKIDEITLKDLKIKAMNQVKLKPKFWLPIDTVEGIQEMVDKAKTFKELILIFK